jgi:hypothetical protein
VSAQGSAFLDANARGRVELRQLEHLRTTLWQGRIPDNRPAPSVTPAVRNAGFSHHQKRITERQGGTCSEAKITSIGTLST